MFIAAAILFIHRLLPSYLQCFILLRCMHGFCSGVVKPDGDMEVQEELINSVRLVPCPSCKDGVMKPDVVFFGDNLPQERTQQSYDLVDQADGLLVLGSTLTVWSSFRLFSRFLTRRGPSEVAIVNIGPVRGEALLPAGHKIEHSIAETLAAALH
eukprot:m.367300 g.367300  ORF g.367300 m.367300 type:complete len:155 (-) comp56076_c0_seq5:225-689(-)